MYACAFAISPVPTLCVTTCTFRKKDEDFDVDGCGDEDFGDGADDDDDKKGWGGWSAVSWTISGRLCCHTTPFAISDDHDHHHHHSHHHHDIDI